MFESTKKIESAIVFFRSLYKGKEIKAFDDFRGLRLKNRSIKESICDCCGDGDDCCGNN